MATTVVLKRGPKLGRKEIFLPNFTLTLLRTPDLPPTFASFYAPLHLNKLDLRDYLWNCYGISVLSVRSFVQQQRIREGKLGDKIHNPRRWFRPRSLKKMTVEMDKPFVWPEVVDLEKWDKSVYEATKKEREAFEKTFQPDASTHVPTDRSSIAQQAKELLKSENSWKTGNSNTKWIEGAEEVEVETDVQIPKLER